MFCKTIILSNSENLTSNAPKGILTLSKENSSIKGKVRLYNLTSLPQSTKIGLYVNEKVYISPIIKKTSHYEFDLLENIDITQSVYCVLIDTDNNKKVLLEGGSFNGFYFTDSPFDAVLEAKDEQLEQTVEKALQNIETCESCNCSNCEYKQYFYDNYSQSNQIETILDKPSTIEKDNPCFNPPIKSKNPQYDFIDKLQSNILDKISYEITNDINQINPFEDNDLQTHTLSETEFDNTDNVNNSPTQQIDNSTFNKSTNTPQEKLDFLNDIVEQLDEMFERYPTDDMLNSIIENSKFVRIDGENPYVLGIIYEDKMLKYIAYGVPAQYNSLPPLDLGQHYQWLPLNPRDVMSDGYFMIYQDATNGNLVEINFEE